MLGTKERVTDTARNVKPYVERALRDEELRQELKRAFTAAKDVYDELIAGRRMSSLASRVATDREVQDNLRTAVEELRNAARRLKGVERHRGRAGALLLAGLALGILFNPVTGPDTRRWIKEKLFGGGGEFDFPEEGSGNGAG